MTCSGQLPFRIGPKDLPSLPRTARLDSSAGTIMHDTKVPNTGFHVLSKTWRPLGFCTKVSDELGDVKLRNTARPVLIVHAAGSVLVARPITQRITTTTATTTSTTTTSVRSIVRQSTGEDRLPSVDSV